MIVYTGGDFFLMITVYRKESQENKNKKGNHKNGKEDTKTKKMKLNFDVYGQNFGGIEIKY